MEKIHDVTGAEAKVLRDMRGLVSQIRRLTAQDPVNVDHGGVQLRAIRLAVAEDLNQIQHECLILRGIGWLLGEGFGSDVGWEWNPRQTGSATEPDLRGSREGSVIVSAEATASELPKGTVDKRMKETLEKLSRLEGQKFYFVATEEMAKRANTKAAKAGWAIRVVCLEHNTMQGTGPAKGV